MIRLVLLGDESSLKKTAEKIKGSLDGAVKVEVVGLDMEDENELTFDLAVDQASKILGGLDSFVSCYSYEGNSFLCARVLFYLLFCFDFFVLLGMAISNTNYDPRPNLNSKNETILYIRL